MTIFLQLRTNILWYLFKDDHFIKAVLKVQRCQEGDLSEDEAMAIEHLLLDDEDITSPSEPARKKTTAELLSDKREARANGGSLNSRYIPEVKECVLGSAAEVERFWSMAGKVLTPERSSMSPFLFELIMYLKYNKDLWGLMDVVEANKRRKGQSASAKAKKEAHRHRVGMIRSEIEAWDADNHR